MYRNLGRRLAPSLLILVALALGGGGGCAQKVGLIDRTQPGLLKKSIFDGEWFMRRTVIDVPYDTDYTFVGETEDVSRIRWEIQKEHLLAYRVHPLVEGTVDAAPLAVFAIKNHVDVQRQYNVATGEQSNVLEENETDRMWYERDYVRVDWSKNLVTNFNFWVEQIDQDPVAYSLEDEADPDRLLIGAWDDVDLAWRDLQDPEDLREADEAQYIDVVTRTALKPEMILVEDDWGDIWLDPACWYYFNYDCAPGTVTVRNSFLRADAALSPDYAPLEYPDNMVARDEDGQAIRVRWSQGGDLTRVDAAELAGGGPPEGTPHGPEGPQNPYAGFDASVARLPMFDKFGYFRTERYGYDPEYGEVEDARLYLINRWNIWERSFDDDGQPIPYADRKIKPIVYYLSPDFPDELYPTAERIVDQWDEAFRATVTELTGEEAPRIFELRENTRALDPETGEVADRGQVNGDLRYSHIYAVLDPLRIGLLGYGPSAADPLTGEIFEADAYIYQAIVKEVAAQGRDIIGLINGTVDPLDLALGENVGSYLATLKAGGARRTPPSREEVEQFASDHAGAGPGAGGKGAGAAKKRAAHAPKKASGEAIHEIPGIERLKRPAGWSRSRLKRVQGTGMEEMLMGDPELVAMGGMGLVGSDRTASSLPPALRDRISPVHWASGEHREKSLERLRGFSRRNMMMATFFDDAVAGLALSLKDADPETVFETLVADIFRSTTEHEVGHTLGLRHNFEGSADALNYHPEYWALRGEDPEPFAPLSQAQIDGRMREYQYSSIMDYAGRFNMDISGLGLYDRAAIMFGYGQLVEVFDSPPDEPLTDLVEYDDGTYGRPYSLAEVVRDFRHYTRFPHIFGGTAGMEARSVVPYTEEAAALMGAPEGSSLAAQLTGDAPWTLWEVPYRFCSDEWVYGTDTCHMFDAGADSYEIVMDTIERYQNYYWFNNFKRQQVFFDEWSYMDSMWWRYFGFIHNAYQNWVFDQWFTDDAWEWLRDDAAAYDIEDKPWTQALDGGLQATAAAREGVRFLYEVLATPEPGGYWYDFDEGYYWAYTNQANLPICEGEWSWYSDAWCTDLNLQLGDGRYLYSIYDIDSGYYFYERLKWIGTFYDKLTALDALTYPDTFFLGVNAAESLDEWAISMYSAFPDEIRKLFGGIAADRFDLFAGVVEEEGWTYVPPNPFATGEEAQLYADSGPVDPSTSFTIQLYALWYGMAWLNANYDNTFNDFAKIWIKGAGEGIEPADPGLTVEFESPLNNRIYVATAAPDTGESTIEHGVGELMIGRANQYVAEWLDALADPTTDAGTVDYLRWRIQNITENIEVVRGLYDLYGYLYF